MEGFKKYEVVPDLIDSVPGQQLSVKYGGKELVPGSVLTPTQVKDEPEVSWLATEGEFYTLIFNDPDAPSRSDKSSAEFNHWLVANIPGSDVSKGQVVSEYIGSGPPKGTGLHRYCFLLFKQPGSVDFGELGTILKTDRMPRRKWNVRKFAEKYGLRNPVAGNFYHAEWDDWVPNIHRQLGLA